MWRLAGRLYDVITKHCQLQLHKILGYASKAMMLPRQYPFPLALLPPWYLHSMYPFCIKESTKAINIPPEQPVRRAAIVVSSLAPDPPTSALEPIYACAIDKGKTKTGTQRLDRLSVPHDFAYPPAPLSSDAPSCSTQ